MTAAQSIESLEQTVVFDCAGEELPGILHDPGSTDVTTGLLLVVGGPQTRVGSHRQFVLLARDLARAGVPVFRFDYRGMGDGSGALRDFSDVDTDIRAAIDQFQQLQPQVRQVVVWGLCDAASAAAFYAWQDPRVSGIVMLNPWVRTPEGEARAVVRHYYLRRLTSRDFWKKLLGGGVHAGRSVKDFLRLLSLSRRSDPATAPSQDIAARMQQGLSRFHGPVLLILSGNDLVAKEFLDRVQRDQPLQDWMRAPQVSRLDIAEADHTFSRAEWRDRVSRATRDWLLDKDGRTP